MYFNFILAFSVLHLQNLLIKNILTFGSNSNYPFKLRRTGKLEDLMI